MSPRKTRHRIVSSKNEIVRNFSSTDMDTILNPISYTQLRGNFSLVQTSLLISIIGQLQDRIKELLSYGGESTLLFSPEDLKGNLLNFEIPLKDLHIPPKKYGELETACEALLHMDMSYKRHDEKEGQDYYVRQNIFHKIEFPTSTVNAQGKKIAYKSGSRRKGIIRIQMVDESAREILNLRKGYTRHLRYITNECRSPRTPRLYIALSAWRKRGERIENYINLKEFFGVLTFSKDRKRIIENKYPKYGAFHRDVLDPVQREMKKLSDQGKIEFYFEYVPIYRPGKTRGDPDSIKFTLIEGTMGEAQQREDYLKKLHKELIRKYQIKPMEWEKMYGILKVVDLDIKPELKRVDRLLKEKKPDNLHAYVTAVLLKWLQKQKANQEAQYVDFVEETSSVHQMRNKASLDQPTRPFVEEAYRERYAFWMKHCKEVLGEVFYEQYMTCCDLWAIRDGYRVIVAVPNEFVKEQWESKMPDVISYFFTAFGQDHLLVYTQQDIELIRKK